MPVFGGIPLAGFGWLGWVVGALTHGFQKWQVSNAFSASKVKICVIYMLESKFLMFDPTLLFTHQELKQIGCTVCTLTGCT